jgi:MoxR-like ATPase
MTTARTDAQDRTTSTPRAMPLAPDDAAIRLAADAFRADFAATRDQIARVIVGQADIIDNTLIALFCGGHTLLEGVPGLGKTLLIRTLSQALDLSFSRIQFTPDLMPADIVGTTILSEFDEPDGRKSRRFTFQRGPIFAQMVLADEINRATPKTQSALLEAMAEKSVTVAGVSHALDKPFFVLATQNPLEQEGTYPLPEAQLDRFFFKLLVTTPTRNDLHEVLNRTTTAAMQTVTPVMNTDRVLTHQSLIRQVAITPAVQDFAVRLVLSTHPRTAASAQPGTESFSTSMVDRFVKVGASPRAAQTLVLAAKCRALLNARSAVTTDDIKAIAAPTLRHRLILTFEAAAEGIAADAIIDNLLSTLPATVAFAAG